MKINIKLAYIILDYRKVIIVRLVILENRQLKTMIMGCIKLANKIPRRM